MAMKPGSSLWLNKEDGDGSENSSIGVESCGMDSYSKGSGGRGRRKEKEKDTRTTESKDKVAAVPRQRRQKACWYLLTQTDKFASTRIPL